MADTGWLNPSTGANNASVGNAAWSSPTNVVSNNGAESTCTVVPNFAAFDEAQWLVATNFGASVPSGATIDGIEIQVDARQRSNVSNQGPTQVYTQLWNAGAAIGSDQGATESGSWVYNTSAFKTYGGSANVWGASLTDTIVNGSGFGVAWRYRRTSAESSYNVSVDVIQIKIYYTEAGSGSSVPIIVSHLRQQGIM